MDLSMVPYRGEAPKNGSAEPDREAEIGEKNSRSPRYWECMKNHAAGLGAQAFDGCGEFMPGGEPGTLEALKCAACGCHRNFHRKEEISSTMDYVPCDHIHPVHHPLVLYNAADNSSSKVPPFFRAGLPHMLAYRPLGLGGSSVSTGSDTPPAPHPLSYSAPEKDRARKRFRTKFTPEQKEEMQKFAEKVGWRIQRHDNDELQEFCSKVGVKRQVLKVWMHNNKSALAGGGAASKAEQPSSAISV